MSDQMTFPKTFKEFAEQYKIIDKEQVYTNGADLIPIFRVEQWLEYTSSISNNKEINKGTWEFWPGWIGNHDKRIEDATCSKCGYVHPTVRRTYGSTETAQDVLNKLAAFCPGCGLAMEVVG